MSETPEKRPPEQADAELTEQDLDSVAGGKTVYNPLPGPIVILPIEPIVCPLPIDVELL